ncbi:hypothetical protein JCM8202_001945 [Rhodotorula sphaerocarpa]
MNVLVYDGSGVSAASRDDTLRFLRTFLGGRYDIQTVSPRSLKEEPWTPNCALLAFPGGRDLPYCHDLGEVGTRRIREYVQAGGRYLGICAGAYFASASIEFEVGSPLEVTGRRQLGFFPGLCRGTVFPGFEYDSNAGVRQVQLTLNRPAWRDYWPQSPASCSVLYNGGGAFLANSEPDPSRWVPLATYDGVDGEPAAGVLSRVEQGCAVLWGVHPEHPLRPSEGGDAATEQTRLDLLRATLTALELDVAPGISAPPRLSPLFLMASRPGLVQSVASSIAARSEVSGPAEVTLQDRHDTYLLRPADASETNYHDPRPTGDSDTEVDPHDLPKVISACEAGLPSPTQTPLFDTSRYFSTLGRESAIGHALMYGEVVTSTQTMLDRNDRFLSCLPDGLVCIASHQVAGRGRGGNSWVSSAGCLQFSLVLRLPQELASRIVFVQYLVGLAVVEAVKTIPGLEQLAICLKWPNDIYADFGETDGSGDRYRKIGGVLINSSYANGVFSLVAGCGVNVSNPKPTTSINAMIQRMNNDSGSTHGSLRSEEVLALIMRQIDQMWPDFVSRGFEPFMDLYLSRWIHRNQVVTLETSGERVRIVGITPDHGLLRTVPLELGLKGGDFFGASPPRARAAYVDLQPDGNRFDILQGLISARSST